MIIFSKHSSLFPSIFLNITVFRQALEDKWLAALMLPRHHMPSCEESGHRTHFPDYPLHSTTKHGRTPSLALEGPSHPTDSLLDIQFFFWGGGGGGGGGGVGKEGVSFPCV